MWPGESRERLRSLPAQRGGRAVRTLCGWPKRARTSLQWMRASIFRVADIPAGRREDLSETVRQVEKLDRRIVARKADVRDFEEIKAAVDAGVGELGRLDIVSASAGVGSQHDRVHEMPEEEWQLMIDINLTGAFHTCKATVPHIIAGGRGGCVVLTGSTACVKGFQNIAHYVAAKHGVLGLMKALANELGDQAIRVNCILPTQVNTPMIMNEKSWRLFRPDLEHPTRDDFAAVSQATGILPYPWVEPVISATRSCS